MRDFVIPQSSQLRTTLQSQAQSRGLLILRVLYFLYFGALGGYWTYLNVYYREIGLSGMQIGLVNTLSPLVSIFAATMWGMVNDRLGRLSQTSPSPVYTRETGEGGRKSSASHTLLFHGEGDFGGEVFHAAVIGSVAGLSVNPSPGRTQESRMVFSRL